MKKLIALSLVLLMAVAAITGCAGKKGDEGDANGDGIKDVLVIGAAAEINTLDLLTQNDQINNICLKLTHETLLFFTNEGVLVPELAESWEYTDDTTLVVKLKQNVKFHDGSAMTAEDVKFTYEMCLDSNSSSSMSGLVSVDVLDPYTVQLNLDSYNNEFLVNLSSINVGIQSKAAYESGMENPYYMGTGQYKFEEWQSGESVTFVRNENYWDAANAGKAEKIIFKPILESSSRTIALQNGEIDVCIDPPINELGTLEKDEGVTVFERAGTRMFYFGFNAAKAPWDNKELRQAVACSINRADVLEVAVEGKGTLQTTVLNHGLWSWYDEMPGFDYDLARAKELLAASGVAAGDLNAKLLIANSTPYTNIATVIQSNLKELGITVTIEQVEDATLKEMCVNGEQELFLWRWNEDQKVDWVYGDLFRSDSSYNYFHYSNPAADDLIKSVLVERDADKRLADAVSLQEMLVEDCPEVPLYMANLVIAYGKNLKGEYLFGGGNHDWSGAYVAVA